MKKASIIIPTLNKLIRLRLVLKSLESQMNDDIEVIVVFDGCDPDVIEGFKELKLSYKPIAVISEENIGRSRARNKGIEAASGEVIIFLDDDRVVSPNYVEEHCKLHKEGYGVVLGQRNQLYMKDSDICHFYEDSTGLRDFCEKNGEIERYVFGQGAKSPIRWMNFYTGNVSVNRQALLDAGGFDPAFSEWGHEDLDLGIRLYIHGVKFAYSTTANNYHLMHASNFDHKKKQCSENLWYLVKKYNRPLHVKLILLALYLKQTIFGVRVSKDQLKKFEMISHE